MANVIDTLIVELALDPTKFTAAQQQAVSAARQMTQQILQQAKETEAAAARITHYFEAVKRAALGALGLFLGGRAVKEFVEETVKVEASMARSARTIGVSAEQLARWGAMARATGGDAQSVTASMQGLSDRIAQAQITGDWGNMLQVFGRLGVHLKTTKDGLVDVDDAMDQINQRLQGMNDVDKRAMLNLLGLGDPSTINLLIAQRQEFIKFREEGEKIAAGMNENAESARNLQRAWNQLVDVADRVATRAFGAISDRLTTIVDKAKELLGLALVDPGSKEGQDVVRRNEEEIRRRFGESPLFPVGPPIDIVETAKGRGVTSYASPTSGALTPSASPRAREVRTEQELLDDRARDFAVVQNRSLPMGKRVGLAAPGRADFAAYLATGPTSSGPGATTNNSTSSTNIGTINVTISGADSPEETGKSVYRWFQRFSQGAATYNGPH